MRIELPEEKKLVHQSTIPMRWGDMDAMGHLNNTVYFRYMEIARLDWLMAVGCPINPQGEGVVIANAFCNFIRQLEFPAEVLVRTYASNPGRSSFDTWAVMERSDQPGVVHATGGATVVWVDFPRQKSAPLPEHLRQLVS
ncbi:acyl-CoA thioesterase [Comamonas flocculans]|uniref:Acyl-CoA thioesterase n=1 Tax=Comamonas flocculans TaxID=2597701 RepID=A0A5B8RTE4_9BURK|nr:acyl-CoA thioesterase [Comamonas flocculans]QEA11994.1 acyl-CoA thioesterase [Comamonas flocculans]